MTAKDFAACAVHVAMRPRRVRWRRIIKTMVEIQPIRVEVEREDDGRILASVPDLPGVMAYGSTAD